MMKEGKLTVEGYAIDDHEVKYLEYSTDGENWIRFAPVGSSGNNYSWSVELEDNEFDYQEDTLNYLVFFRVNDGQVTSEMKGYALRILPPDSVDLFLMRDDISILDDDWVDLTNPPLKMGEEFTLNFTVHLDGDGTAELVLVKIFIGDSWVATETITDLSTDTFEVSKKISPGKSELGKKNITIRIDFDGDFDPANNEITIPTGEVEDDGSDDGGDDSWFIPAPPLPMVVAGFGLGALVAFFRTRRN